MRLNPTVRIMIKPGRTELDEELLTAEWRQDPISRPPPFAHDNNALRSQMNRWFVASNPPASLLHHNRACHRRVRGAMVRVRPGGCESVLEGLTFAE